MKAQEIISLENRMDTLFDHLERRLETLEAAMIKLQSAMVKLARESDTSLDVLAEREEYYFG